MVKASPARRLAPVASLAALLLSACASQAPDVRIQTLAHEVKPADAIVVPPPGGPAVVSVLERRFANGVSQEIILSTTGYAEGQNAIYVTLVDQFRAPSGDENPLKAPSLAPDVIAKEMDRRLPGVEMKVSPYFVQNKYGPFGYAAGTSDAGDTCVYAFQTIEPNEKSLLNVFRRGLISIRLRVCEPAAPEEALLRVMYDFSVVGHIKDPWWDPYGDVPGPHPDLGETGAPIYPVSRNGHARPLSDPIGSPVPDVTFRPARAPIRTTAAPLRRGPLVDPADQEPLPGYPSVPPPP